MKVKETHLVEKRNVFNEIKAKNMTLQEMRLIDIYLARINPRDIETRKVKFTVKNFQAIMNLKRGNIQQLKDTADKLLQHIVTLPLDSGGFKKFQIFKECVVEQDERTLEWYFEIDAHDNSIPLMFDYKKEYFKFKLGNVLRLDSTNKIKMYEFLKQFERVGKKEVSLEELKDFLGIAQNKYTRWVNLADKVIKPCQKALLDYTDISFTYEQVKGYRGKITGIIFFIAGNKNYDIALDKATMELIGCADQDCESNAPICLPAGDDTVEEEPYNFSVDNDKDLYFQACKREFTESEMVLILEIVNQSPIFSSGQDRELSICEYLSKKHKELCYRDSKNPIKYRFAYFKKLLEVGKVKLEAEEQLKEFETNHKSRRSNYNLERKPSYDIEAYENDNVFSDSLDQNLEKLNASNVVQFKQF